MLPECRAEPPRPFKCVDPRVLDDSYVYLLGIYLGDGMLTRLASKPVWKLRLFQDARYSRLLAECSRAMFNIVPNRIGRVQRSRDRAVELISHWKHWICLFPQHGPGPKHTRTIQLAPWQANLVRQFPHELIKGLIESDGCRITNFALVRGKRYEYPRYFFTNASADIQQIFRDACDLIGVQYRQDGPRNISVARRESVAVLDEFIGPKS